uniref:Reverse transcriptase domain-containing protein n=1 Tax=Tanacetum cinerariifolium TaxID=118510 RepID=A0A6L2JFN6_TANCI|nr:hypothetical protein [Tanacetum cinerariifolium]
MLTRSYSNLPVVSPSNPSTLNPKRRNHKRSKQPFILEESPIDTMVDQRTMAEFLRALTEGYAEAIVVPPILAEQFELKHSLINMMASDQFFRLEMDNPHDHICCTTSSSLNHFLKEFADELALIPFSPRNDDLPFDIESDLKEIEYLLHHDPIKDMDSILKDLIDQRNLADLNDNLADTMPEMFSYEHTLDYSSPLLYDKYDDDLFEDFSKVEALPSTNNEDKVFNLSILIQEYLFKVITCVALDKKPPISHASLILEDFDPPLYELPFFKEVPITKTLLSFSSKNKENVFKPGIHTSKGVYSSLMSELSHRGYEVFKIIKILKSPMKIFLFSHREDICILDIPCPHERINLGVGLS